MGGPKQLHVLLLLDWAASPAGIGSDSDSDWPERSLTMAVAVAAQCLSHSCSHVESSHMHCAAVLFHRIASHTHSHCAEPQYDGITMHG